MYCWNFPHHLSHFLCHQSFPSKKTSRRLNTLQLHLYLGVMCKQACLYLIKTKRIFYIPLWLVIILNLFQWEQTPFSFSLLPSITLRRPRCTPNSQHIFTDKLQHEDTVNMNTNPSMRFVGRVTEFGNQVKNHKFLIFQ